MVENDICDDELQEKIIQDICMRKKMTDKNILSLRIKDIFMLRKVQRFVEKDT